MNLKEVLKDIVIDLESVGSGGNTAILQLAAVQFNRYNGKKGKSFKMNVDLQSCFDLGLKPTGDTIYWWFEKSDEARKSVLEKPRVHIAEVIQKFNKFLLECAEEEGIEVTDLSLWGRSPRFDIAILYDIYRLLNLTIIWDLRKEMCVRTIESLGIEIKKQIDLKNKDRIVHDGIVDCLHEIEYISAIYQEKKLD